MVTSFFDYIGTADMERIHSATIAWMLSDSCKAFELDERVYLLNKLFGSENNDIKSIIAYTEFEHIDIAFLTVNSNGEKEYWAIENKIKAPLGYNQLTKYKEIINAKKKHLAVLSLIGTLPQDSTESWYIATYADLLEGLQFIYRKKNNSHQHYAIVKEYCECLSNLINVLEQFRAHHERFDFVFTDGNKKKSTKSGKLNSDNFGINDYISMNGLETLLQKDYFVGIIKELKSRGINLDCHVSETHGNADFAFHLGDMGYLPSYLFDLSFQNGTFKFAVTEKGYPKLRVKNKEKWPLVLKQWINAFGIIQGTNPKYIRLNMPKSRVRVSVSYNFDKEIGDNRRWYDLSTGEFVDKIVEQIDYAQKMALKAIEYHRNNSEMQIINT